MKSSIMLQFLLCSLAASGPAAAQQPVAIVAHRGLQDGVPENTLAAFRHAAARGVRIIELDLRLTRDGQVVVLHDETLDRTTDCSGRLEDRTLDELRACDAGWPTHPGERVPTFAAVLQQVRGTPMRVLADVKPGTPLDSVLAVIRDHRAEDSVILGLRQIGQVERARAALPRLSLLAFMPDASDAPAFARSGAHIIRIWSDWVERDPGLVSRTRALGPEVWLMVGRRLPKREQEWRSLHSRMMRAGAQGLITDRPDLISPP
jgi:glycerophosphoryl diester phosphodiesterase